MKKLLYGLAIFPLMLSSSSIFAMSEEQAEMMCKEYAQEDRIAAEDMAEYMAECIQDLIRSDSEEKNN